jgi:glycosyltransferase involved in cell wall biosynthesis
MAEKNINFRRKGNGYCWNGADDLFILPGLWIFPVSWEAMASGLPVLSPAQKAFRIVDNENGVLIPPGKKPLRH